MKEKAAVIMILFAVLLAVFLGNRNSAGAADDWENASSYMKALTDETVTWLPAQRIANHSTEEDLYNWARSLIPEVSETKGAKEMKLMIDNTPVSVLWEDNPSVEELKRIVAENPLTIEMSMYGGFEQVGPFGLSLPRQDQQTTTASGDIVLYSGNQIVIFYGSNSWAYTRLGHILDKSQTEMQELLGKHDVTVTMSYE